MSWRISVAKLLPQRSLGRHLNFEEGCNDGGQENRELAYERHANNSRYLADRSERLIEGLCLPVRTGSKLCTGTLGAHDQRTLAAGKQRRIAVTMRSLLSVCRIACSMAARARGWRRFVVLALLWFPVYLEHCQYSK